MSVENKIFIQRLSKYLYIIVLAFILLLGCFLRIRLYILNPGLHHDEANLALNMMNNSFGELFMPLDRNQICPPLFLIISKFIYGFLKFNNCAEFSDMLLRFFPLISGISVMFLFPILLNSIYKNKLFNLIGTLVLALNRFAVYYSCVFKQYSFELLIAVLIMLIFYNLNLSKENFNKNIFLFILLGLSPLLSYSSYFFIIGIAIYLIYSYFKSRENCILYYLIAVILPAFIIGLLVILPSYFLNKAFMGAYWHHKFELNFIDFIQVLFYPNIYDFNFNYLYISIAIVISCGIMLKENLKLFLIVCFPFIITFLSCYYSMYPAEERLLLFIYPSFIIIFLFIISMIKIFRSCYINIIFNCLILLYLCNFILYPTATVDYILKPDVARDVWEYFYKNYDGNTPVIFAGSKNSQEYYSKFFPVNRTSYSFSNNMSCLKLYNKIHPGTYYIIANFGKYNNLYLRRKLLADTNILEYKIFVSPWIINRSKNGWYIKFEKKHF